MGGGLFQVVQAQIPIVEQAIEAAALMLVWDRTNAGPSDNFRRRRCTIDIFRRNSQTCRLRECRSSPELHIGYLCL